MSGIRLHTSGPIVGVLAETKLRDHDPELLIWLITNRPECGTSGAKSLRDLLPHKGKDGDSDGELLVEIAGRKCYDSFGDKAGQRTNKAYIENTQRPPHPHASIMYHAKMTFLIAGISMRVARELIRHYVGADRDEEGSPSAESTRYTEHYGSYVLHPRDKGNSRETIQFAKDCAENRRSYKDYLERAIGAYKAENNNKEPRGMARKRIYEAAASRLSLAAETSLVWTTNPAALTKLILEREHEDSDLEFQELAKKLRKTALENWPNLFPRLQENQV